MKIVVPIAGKSSFFDDKNSPFSKPLVEIRGKSMIEHVIKNLEAIHGNSEFIFVVNKEDCKRFHLDNILRLLTKSCKIIKVTGTTKGALCSILLAIEHINAEEEILISNGDQVLDYDINNALDYFRSNNYSAGVVTFNSIHPRWSYVRLDDNGEVVETAEKRPLSKHAIAGVYYFKSGIDFVESGMETIKKDANVNGLYYIAPVINQMILKNKRVGIQEIDSKKYHSFYSPQKIKEFENGDY